MLANWITLSRFPLLPVALLALYLGSPGVRVAGAGLLFVGLMLDTVDGVVARRRGETSLFGSVLDIAADRTYELVLWIWFASLGLIPVMIPLVVIARTTLTDAFRSVGVAEGTAPFRQHRTGLSRFLVSSSWMRSGYAITKVVTFCGLALVQALRTGPGVATGHPGTTALAALGVLAWVSVGFCVLRGLPVLGHALRQYRPAWGNRPPRQTAPESASSSA
jgi:phosphatidylglycerophosphate synthase